jgi:hypothetical protein
VKVKKPKSDMADHGYLGHFAKEKYLCQGHNDSGTIPLKPDNDGMDDMNWLVPSEDKKPLPVKQLAPDQVDAKKKAALDLAAKAQAQRVAAKKAKKKVTVAADED